MARQTVQVITDSTADIPPALAQAAGIWVVPLSVRFGSEVYRDGVDITADQFYGKLRSWPGLPATSAPAAGIFAERYREALAAGRSSLGIHLSSKLSGTYSAAATAAAEFGDEVAVLDSRSASMALGWIVLAAAERARAGASLAEVRELAESLIPRAHVYLTLDSLENLRKGGRIGRATALLGTLLNVKPIITVIDGEVAPVERVRTFGKALSRLAELVAQHGPIERLAVGYTDVPEVAGTLRELVEKVLPGVEVLTFQAGPVIGTHVGHGAVGITFITRK